jgi:hypothetical protein
LEVAFLLPSLICVRREACEFPIVGFLGDAAAGFAAGAA